MKTGERAGFHEYARWCGIMKHQPMATVEFVADGVCGRTAIQRFISVMYAAGLLHIAEWRNEAGKPIVPRFKFGRGQDARYPTMKPNGRPVGGVAKRIYADHSPEVSRFAAAIKAFEDVSTVAEAAEASGINRWSLRTVAKSLVKHGIISVVGWDQTPGNNVWIPSYQVDGGKNVRKPSSRPIAEIQREYESKRRDIQAARALMEAWRPAA